MTDVYEQAAEAARIPGGDRSRIVQRVREKTEERVVSDLAEQMHDAMMSVESSGQGYPVGTEWHANGDQR